MPLPDLVKVSPRAPSAENSIAPLPPLPAAITSAPEPPIPAGNLVAKLGLVILFIGIGFLLKYAAAAFTIPIECAWPPWSWPISG